MIGAIRRLAWVETKLFVREPLALAFTFALPVITVLVLGGVFDVDDPAFEGAPPSDYYVAAYLGVVIAAVGVIMLPVHLAAYRERGILRRLEASHLPRWSLPVAHVGVSFGVIVVASVVLLITAALSYGIPTVESLSRTIVGFVVGSLSFTALGFLLGTALPNARAAQGIGLVLFLPMFLLGGAGPPPDAMSDAMRTISDYNPLTHVIRAIQEPWLDIGSGTPHLVVAAAVGLGAIVVWVVVAARKDQRA